MLGTSDSLILVDCNTNQQTNELKFSDKINCISIIQDKHLIVSFGS